MKHWIPLLVISFSWLVEATAVAQGFPYPPSMFEASNSWRGRVRFTQSPSGAIHYRRVWRNGITPQGAALGTTFINGAFGFLGSENFGKLLGAVGAPDAADAPTLGPPEEYADKIAPVIAAIVAKNATMESDINKLAKAWNVDGVEPLPKPIVPSPEKEGSGDPKRPGEVMPPPGPTPSESPAETPAAESEKVTTEDLLIQRKQLARLVQTVAKYPKWKDMGNARMKQQAEAAALYQRPLIKELLPVSGDKTDKPSDQQFDSYVLALKEQAVLVEAMLGQHIKVMDESGYAARSVADRELYETYVHHLYGYLADLRWTKF